MLGNGVNVCFMLIALHHIRCEVYTVVTMNVILWDVTLCGSYKN